MRILGNIRSGCTAIGVDIGSRQIKAAQLRPKAGGWDIECVASFPRHTTGTPLDADEARRIRQILDRLGFRGRELILSLPSEMLLTAMLELPPRAPGVPVDQIALGEFARVQNRRADELEMAYWDLPVPARAAKATYLMAVGCAIKDADQLLATLEQAGLSVLALDHFTSALARACGSLSAVPPATTAFLDLGWSAATLGLVSSGELVYERRMPEIAGRLLHESIQKQFDLDPEEAALALSQASLLDSHESSPDVPALRELLGSYAQRLVQELKLAFSYVARQYTDATVAGVLLTGGGTCIGGLTERLSAELEVHCRQVSPMQLASYVTKTGFAVPGGTSPTSEMVPAIGLAMFPLT